ncbi:Suppressor of IKBKE 1 [Bienertia sinuspersici]
MGLVEAWEKSHMRKDGSFVAGTITEDFLSDAKAKVDLLKLNNSSSSSVDVEDEAFHSLMNGGDIPERPQGFGFGVKKSDVYGVRGILRKQGSRKVKIRDLDVNASVSNTNKTNEVLKKENRELSMKNDENTRTLKTVLTQFSQILDAVRKGKASGEGGGCRSEAGGGGGLCADQKLQQQQSVMVVRVCADQKLL